MIKSYLILPFTIFISLLFLFSSAILAQERIEEGNKIQVSWQFRDGLTYKYSLYGTISEPEGEPSLSTVCSQITVASKNAEEALFTNTYSEIRWQERGIWYISPEEELKRLSFAFTINRAGKVTLKEDNKELAKSLQEYMDALIPLPQTPISPGDSFPIEIKSENLAGTCVFRGYEKESGVECAFFEVRLATPHDTENSSSKELVLKMYFDYSAGRLIRVRRRIVERVKEQNRNDKEKRTEELTISYISSSEDEQKLALLIENCKRELELHPDNVEMHLKLADLYFESGKVTEAAEELENAARLKPSDANIFSKLGEIYLSLADAREALQKFITALEIDKSSKKALAGASKASFYLGEYEDAARFARLYLESDKKQFEGYYLLGIALAKLGKTREAKEALERYIQLNPNLDQKEERVIAFTQTGDVKILVKKKLTIKEGLKYSEDEIERGREVIRVLVKEESVRLRLTPRQVEQFLDYIAKIYGKTAPEMISDFLADREETAKKLKSLIDEYARVPVEKMEMVFSQETKDALLLRAACSFLSPEKSIPILKKALKTFPEDAGIRFDLGCLYLSRGENFFKEAVQEFELARDLDKSNSLYDYALAYIDFKMHNQSGAIKALTCAVEKQFRMERAILARKRLSLLDEVKYKDELRKVTAWTSAVPLAEKFVKDSLEALMHIAQGLFLEGNAKEAGVFAELGKYAALSLEKNAESPLLLIIARSIREAALLTLTKIYAKTGDVKKEKETKEQFSALVSENSFYLKAYLSFQRSCEDAFQVLPVTAPADGERFIEQLLAGEMKVFDSELAEVLKPQR